MGQLNMGIDLVKRGRIQKRNKTATRSNNLYQHLLIKLFTFLSRRTDSSFCKTVLRRLIASRVNRPPVSLSRMIRCLGSNQGRTAVVVGVVTDDQRTLDKLVMQTPSGTNTLLLRGPKEREARRHFGAL